MRSVCLPTPLNVGEKHVSTPDSIINRFTTVSFPILLSTGAFNIIRFDQDTLAFRPDSELGFSTIRVDSGTDYTQQFVPVPATEENLAAAWEFVESWTCSERDARGT